MSRGLKISILVSLKSAMQFLIIFVNVRVKENWKVDLISCLYHYITCLKSLHASPKSRNILVSVTTERDNHVWSTFVFRAYSRSKTPLGMAISWRVHLRSRTKWWQGALQLYPLSNGSWWIAEWVLLGSFDVLEEAFHQNLSVPTHVFINVSDRCVTGMWCIWSIKHVYI